jgi:hypothetical protein
VSGDVGAPTRLPVNIDPTDNPAAYK